MTPTKNDTTSLRALHGGGWNGSAPLWVRAASRGTLGPADRHIILGFRTTLAGRTPR